MAIFERSASLVWNRLTDGGGNMERAAVCFGLVLCLCFPCALTGFNTLKKKIEKVCLPSRSIKNEIGPRPLWNATHTDKLRRDLLLNYDKFARPAQHYNTTTVKFGMVITHVDINEFKSSCTVYCWVRLMWNDEKLKWNASQYGNLDSLHLADHEIWQPDIFLYNGAPSTAVNHYGNTHTIVQYTGDILWVPPAQFTALCEINLRLWPFDSQQCSFKFGSWTYNGEQVDLQIYDNATEIEKILLIKSSEWTVGETTVERSLVYYSCCEHPYPDVTINITLHRISPSYKAIIITPAIAVIFMTLMTFWLPPQAGEKIILQGCTAIIITLFLLYFTQKLPAMGSHTPLVVLFYSSSLYIVCFSLIGSIAVIWISRTRHSYNLPWIFKQPLIGWLGKWLGLGHYIAQTTINAHRVTAEEMRDHQVTDMEDNNTNDDHQMIGNVAKTPLQQDWVLFAAAIDRLSFIFYSLLFFILSVAYSL